VLPFCDKIIYFLNDFITTRIFLLYNVYGEKHSNILFSCKVKMGIQSMTWSYLRKNISSFSLVLVLCISAGIGFTGSLDLSIDGASAQTGGHVPGSFSGNQSDSEFWRAIKGGVSGRVSIPDKQAGQLVQADGDNWRLVKNGALSIFGGVLIFSVVLILALFYLIRGKIEVESGMSGNTIERFNGLERVTHWLTASSLIALAFTGLNILYGKFIIMPIFGSEIFSTVTSYGKLVHNYIGFAFILGIVMMFILWFRHNIPNRADLSWLAVGGGMFSKGVHPPAKRFNAGQKLIFWAVILGGASLSVSGLALIFPFEMPIWAGTFNLMNMVGLSLPTNLTALQETQLSVLWHSFSAMVMIAIIIGHIYIGSVGMEGAIEAVGSGQVDINWAREHHNLWLDEVENKKI
jgi:formate dehydrogenase subunit gamma